METIIAEIQQLQATARAYSSENEALKAEETFLQVMQRAEKALGTHRLTVQTYSDLGYFYQRPATLNLHQSEMYYRLALSEAEKVYGYSKKQVLGILVRLIDVVEEAKGPEQCEGLIRRALEGYTQAFGPYAGETISLMRRLGRSIFSHNLPEAVELFRMRFYRLQGPEGKSGSFAINAAVELAYLHYRQYTHAAATDAQELTGKIISSLVETLLLCVECPAGWEEITFMLGRACLWCQDDINANVAFSLALRQQCPGFLCDGCNQALGDLQTLGAICRVCKDMYLCGSCYELYKTDSSKLASVPTECGCHPFYEYLAKAAPNFDIHAWLQHLQESIQQRLFARDSKRFGSAVRPHYIGEFPNADYTSKGFAQSGAALVSKPDQEREIWALEAVERDLLALRMFQVQERIPRMLLNWFSLREGIDYRVGNLERENEVGDQVYSRVEAFLRIALDSENISAETEQSHVPFAGPQNSIYRQKDLILESGLPHVRVLELMSCDSSTAKAKMIRIDLRDAPQFDALSYVWGPPEPCKQLEINGEVFKISPNLHEAIYSLSRVNSLHNLWVDAVCINQMDLQERHHQVMMMADIYRSASTVRIFLGKDLPAKTALFRYWKRTQTLQETPIEKAAAELGAPLQNLLNDFLEFILRPWWIRVWTQQEYALARNDPVFHVGESSVPASTVWRDLNQLKDVIFLNMNSSEGTEKFPPQLSYQGITSAIIHTCAVLNQRHQERKGLTLSGPLRILFQHSPSLRCSDSRDRLYGMREFSEPIARRLFSPDYCLPEENLYEKLAAWLLVYDGWEEMFWLYPLKMANRGRSRNIPSWVPDFSTPLSSRRGSIECSEDIHRKLSDELSLSAIERRIDSETTVGFGQESLEPPTMYNKILAIGGREMDIIERTLPLGSAPWTETLSKLWFIQQHTTSEHLGSFHGSSNLFAPLLNRHKPKLFNAWACGTTDFPIPPLSSFQEMVPFPIFLMVLDEEYQYTLSRLSILSRKINIQDFAPESKVGKFRAELHPFSGQSHELQTEKSHAQLKSTPEAVMGRLFILSDNLKSGIYGRLDLLGAALFDFDNLKSQLEHLCVPSETCGYERLFLQIFESQLRTVLNPMTPETSEIKPDPMARSLPGIDTPIYDSLQTMITECETETEVRMRVQFVLRVAERVRSAASTNHSPPNEWSRAGVLTKATPHVQHSHSTSGNATLGASRSLPEKAELEQSLAHLTIVHEGQERIDSTGQKDEENTTLPASQVTLNIAFNQTNYERLVREVEAQWQNRTFFFTKRGLVGFGAPGVSDIRENDMVILLQNTNMPLIIRESANSLHEIVGFSVVRELADENWNQVEALKTLPRRVFKFR